MALRAAFSPSCTLSLHKSFLKDLDIRPFLQFGKPDAFIKWSPTKLHQHFRLRVWKTQEAEDSTLVDIQESSNEHALFKFGTTQLYDDPPRFIASSIAQVKPAAYTDAAREVIDCTALVYKMPQETSLVSPLHWGYHAHWGYLADEDTTGPSLKLPFEPEKSIGLSMNHIQSHSSGNLAYHEFGNESIVDFLQILSPNVEMAKQLPTNITFEDGNPHCTNLCMGGMVESMKSSTVRRADRMAKKARPRHKKPTRDLYRSSSFQLYELIFSYPFKDSKKASVTWKAVPKDNYAELFDVLNQVAVGLAGGGLAIMLFVASRMLCLNATLDSSKFMSLLRGVGLLWISSALQKLGGVLRLTTESIGKGRPERKEQLAMLRKEVHSFTFKVCAMVLLSMVRLV